MPVHTHTSNATSRPGLVDLPSPKCARWDIDEDDARTKSVAKKSRKAIKSEHQESIKTIAMLEDAIKRQEEDIRKYSTRPDLRPHPRTSAEPAKSESESEKGLVLTISALTS